MKSSQNKFRFDPVYEQMKKAEIIRQTGGGGLSGTGGDMSKTFYGGKASGWPGFDMKKKGGKAAYLGALNPVAGVGDEEEVKTAFDSN